VKRLLHTALTKSGKGIYAIIPSRRLREICFRIFLWLVRNRHTVAHVDGVSFDLDLGEMIDVCVYLQQYERDVVKQIDKYCHPGSTVLDIGANIGAHCLRFAKITGPTGRVFAFEPTDYAYQKLIRNLSLNPFPHVSAYKLALSDINDPVRQIEFRSSWRTDGSRHTDKSIVEFVRLDDWCERHDVQHVDMMKIDVDGNEYAILNGARSLLQKSKPIIVMEVGAWHFKDEQANPLKILEESNYRFWDTRTDIQYRDLGEIRLRLPLTDEQMAFSINIVAVALDHPTNLPGLSAKWDVAGQHSPSAKGSFTP
jgi:FkbM family methyltransferase